MSMIFRFAVVVLLASNPGIRAQTNVAGMALSGAQPPWLFVAFPGFGICFAGTFYLLFLLRCPRCRGPIWIHC